MKKRVLAFLLSSIMVLSSAGTAFATDGELFLGNEDEESVVFEEIAEESADEESEEIFEEVEEIPEESANLLENMVFPTGLKLNDQQTETVKGSNYDEATFQEVYESYYVTPKLPALRDQNPYGACWAFATLALTEINLMKTGTISDPDLSELHLAYFAYNTVEDPLGGTADDYSSVKGNGLLNMGGNFENGFTTLQKWTGAASETTVPYSWASKAQSSSGLSASYAYQDVAHLENGMFTNVDLDSFRSSKDVTMLNPVKKMIKEYGAAGMSFGAEDSLYGATSGNVYNAANNAYYNKTATTVNHAVVIVGWDDNFSRNNFSTKAPGDGAFLVRNSWWNKSYGYSQEHYTGYFWMSYYEASLWPQFYGVKATSADNYDNNYQYDGYNAGYYGYGPSTAANVFTAHAKGGEDGEVLKAVSFDSNAEQTAYTIEIYKDVKTSPSTGTLVSSATTTGVTEFAGSITVPLKNEVFLKAGTKFAVVVKLADGGGIYYDVNFSGNDYQVTANDGESYAQYYGNSWMSWDSNFRIKAYTDNSAGGAGEDEPDPEPEPEPENELSKIILSVNLVPYTDAWGNTEIKEKITYSFDPEDYVPEGDFVWTSTNTDVATIDSDGIITYHSIGKTTIVGSVDGVSGTFELSNCPKEDMVKVTVNSDYSITFKWNSITEAKRYCFMRDGNVKPSKIITADGSDEYEYTDYYYVDKSEYIGESIYYNFGVEVEGEEGDWYSAGFWVTLTPEEESKLSSIKIELNTVEYDGNKPAKVQATLAYDPEDYIPKGKIEWKSSDPITATIDSNGLVSLRNPGMTTIFAIVDGVTGSVDLSNSPSVDDIDVTVNSDYSVTFKWDAIYRAESYDIDRVVDESFYTVASIWDTDKEYYEFTDSYYVDSPEYYGKTVEYCFGVYVNGEYVGESFEVELIPTEPQETKLESMELVEDYSSDSTVILKPVYTPSDYVPKEDIVWASSDELTATVDQKGVVTFKDFGETEISATVDGVTATKSYEKSFVYSVDEEKGKVTFSWNKSPRASIYEIYRDGENIFTSLNRNDGYTYTDTYYYDNPPKEDVTVQYKIVITGTFGKKIGEREVIHNQEIKAQGTADEDPDEDPDDPGEDPGEDPGDDTPENPDPEKDEDWGDIRDEFIMERFDYEPSQVPSDAWYVVGEDVITGSDSSVLDYTLTYTGSKITFDDEISVYYGKKKLTNKTDYSIKYAKNVAISADNNKPSFTVKLKKYSGGRTIYFNIAPASLADAVIASETIIPVAKGNKKLSSIKPKITFNGKPLKAGKDYTLVYEGPDGEVEKPSKEKLNQVDDTYTISVVAADDSNFTDATEQQVTVIVIDSKDSIAASKLSMGNAKGKTLKFGYCEITPETEIRDLFAGGEAFVYYKKKALTLGVDYEIDAFEKDYTTVGTHKIRIIGMDGGEYNFVGSKTVSFKVIPYSFSNDDGERLSIEVEDMEYTKKAVKPEVTVYFTAPDGEVQELKKGVDYTLTYKNNRKVADSSDDKAPTVIIKGKGRFTGSAKQTFSIYD